MKIKNISLKKYKETQAYVQYKISYNSNKILQKITSAKIVGISNNNIIIDISNNSNTLNFFNKLDKYYNNNSIYTKNKYNILYNNIVNNNSISMVVTDNTSIIYNSNNIKLKELSIGDNIDCTIELYCYYVKPTSKKASFILKTHNIVKNKIYINSDSIDILSDEKNTKISKLNELLNNTESIENNNSFSSNSSIETKSNNNTSSEIEINKNNSNDNNNDNLLDNNSSELTSSSEKIRNILRRKLT
jgi:hypothetical protein